MSSSTLHLRNTLNAALQHADDYVEQVQQLLNFDTNTPMIASNPHYNSNTGLGRVGLIGFLLGIAFGIHVMLFWTIVILNYQSSLATALMIWSQYFMTLSFFHFMEFFITSISQPSKLSYDSFVVNHSKNYTIAALMSWTEFWIEYLLFGSWKFSWRWLNYLGILMVIMGQAVRSLAMYQCGENFSHLIADKKHENHQLVTTGIYKFLRHPSYFGWFYWSIGTQMVLCNPICIVAYTMISYMFFKVRIQYEERLLVRFFGQEYVDYISTSHIGIPLIESYNVEDKQNL